MFSFKKRIACDETGTEDVAQVSQAISKLETKLNAAKSQMDKYYESKNVRSRFVSFWRFMDASIVIKRRLTEKLGFTVTNAFLKMIELAVDCKLVDTTQDLVHFDNGALPGAFIMAMRTYMEMNSQSGRYIWHGSSLIDPDNPHVLTDEYGLWASNPDNFMMNESNNGDVTLARNIADWSRRIKTRPNLYTSDIGMDVTGDYNNQESIHMHANFGQVVAALALLRQGGHMVIKMYTFFKDFSIGLIALAAQHFDEFYITKPFSSRPSNSEIYLVGRCFRGISEFELKKLLVRIDDFDAKQTLVSTLPKSCAADICESAKEIYTRQANRITEGIRTFNSSSQIRQKFINEAKETRKKVARKWFEQYIQV